MAMAKSRARLLRCVLVAETTASLALFGVIAAAERQCLLCNGIAYILQSEAQDTCDVVLKPRNNSVVQFFLEI